MAGKTQLWQGNKKMFRHSPGARIGLALMVMLAVAAASAQAATLFVDDDAAGNPVQDGSVESPFATIQQEIDAADEGADATIVDGQDTGHFLYVVEKGGPMT